MVLEVIPLGERGVFLADAWQAGAQVPQGANEEFALFGKKCRILILVNATSVQKAMSMWCPISWTLVGSG